MVEKKDICKFVLAALVPICSAALAFSTLSVLIIAATISELRPSASAVVLVYKLNIAGYFLGSVCLISVMIVSDHVDESSMLSTMSDAIRAVSIVAIVLGLISSIFA